MNRIKRGVIVAAAAISSAGALIAAAAPAAPMAVTVTVHADRAGARIERDVYGQFAEHLGRGIYEGVWVGEDSPIANTRGYRNDVVAALKALHVPLVRWPGGCFADEYHWREGIGPRASRPVKINTSWGGVEERNQFGTHEFLDFAELIGAEAYITGNVGSGSPQEMAEWIEYITSPTQSTIAQLRRRNGRDQPWRLPSFGIGNENWGCGGNMSAEYYADELRRFAAFIKAPRDNTPRRVAGGPHDDDYNWTEVLMSRAAGSMDALSLHYYTFPGKWEDKGPATGFSEDQWASTLQHALHIDELITRHSAIMDKYDPQRRIGLYVDEWGTWYDAEPGSNPAFLFQQNTLRDALVAGVSLNIFHRHAERVRMTSIAQMINVLQAMILTDGDRMILTPTYHVFRMYAPFQGSTSLPVDLTAPDYHRGASAMPALSVSAARDAEGHVLVALVNLDPNRAADVVATLVGARPRAVRGQLLTAPAMDGHNTFALPAVVQPVAVAARVDDGQVRVQLPAKSVVVLSVDP